MAFERNTAIKCTVEDINKSVFVKKEGFESSYCVSDYGNISRANIMGVIVSVDGNLLMLDDGTGKLTLRSFEPILNPPELGNIITVIGKPREFNQERYLMPEILKVITNPLWIDVRKQELENRKKVEHKELPPVPQTTEQEIKKEFAVDKTPKEESIADEPDSPEIDVYTQLKNYLKEHDSGAGVSVAQLESLKIENFENLLTNLLAEGEIYEIKPGFIKLLE